MLKKCKLLLAHMQTENHVTESRPSVRGTYLSGHWFPPCVPCPGCASVTETCRLRSNTKTVLGTVNGKYNFV